MFSVRTPTPYARAPHISCR